MAFLEKPKGWKYWFKKSVRLCFPMEQDFYGCWEVTKDFVLTIGGMLLKLVVRFLLLLTSPISIPILTILGTGMNSKTMKRRAEILANEWDGMPPQYTQEQVDRVLRGGCTLEQLEKEREVKWASG